MNPTGWTLQWSDPVTKAVLGTVALEGLGALEGGRVTGSIRFSFASHRQSTCTIRLPGVNPKATPQIPFEAPVIVFKGPGATNPVFQGRRIDRPGTASPGRTGVTYTFADAYYDLDHVTFKQKSEEPGFILWPDIVLFQSTAFNTPGAYIKTSDQIVHILTYAIASAGVNMQVGTIDICEVQPWPAGVLPNPTNSLIQLEPQGFFVPFYPCRCVKISEAIKVCLKVHPDCFTEIDYTTTPPTFNIRRRSALFTPNSAVVSPMVAKNLPYSYTDADGLRHTATDIQERPELQPKRIALYYQISGTGFHVDAYGYGPVAPFAAQTLAVNDLPATEGLRAMDYSVNLAGPTSNSVSAILNTEYFNPASLDLWKLKCQPLKSPDITGLAFSTPSNISVKDDYGNAIDYGTYAFYIASGSVADWMNVSVIEANVSADFTYSKPNGKAEKHTQHFRVKLCNYDSLAVPNGNIFTATWLTSTGEMIPVGLAKGVFNALLPLQYSLTHHMVEMGGFQGFVKPGKHCINLVVNPDDVVAGDLSAQWAAMNAAVQSTDYVLHADGQGNVFAEFDVKCGPVEHLEAGELVQLMNLFTNRRTAEFDMSSRVGQSSGLPMPALTEKENSTNDIPTLSSHSLFTPLTDGTGNPDTTKPQIKFDIADIPNTLTSP